MTDPVAELLARRFPSHHHLLRLARRWNRGTDPADLDAAGRLLAALTAPDRYPTALHLWYERAFNLVRRGRPADAEELLADVDRRFGGRLDEDTYCLWGRLSKDRGHAHLDAGLPLPAGDPRRTLAFELADEEYATAAGRYRRACEAPGSEYPAVNVAFLALLRAALALARGRAAESAALAAEARQRADAVLAPDRARARRQADDHVWQLATRGEAAAILGRWDDAVAHYHAAATHPDARPHHPQSMGGQLRRVTQAHGLLGQPVPADLPGRLAPLEPYLRPAAGE